MPLPQQQRSQKIRPPLQEVWVSPLLRLLRHQDRQMQQTYRILYPNPHPHTRSSPLLNRLNPQLPAQISPQSSQQLIRGTLYTAGAAPTTLNTTKVPTAMPRASYWRSKAL
uniref:Uncharacterized protein n=1 Tax=Tetraselmis chuii TaxID=63592 RepID=A0A7S1X793_9CHLO